MLINNNKDFLFSSPVVVKQIKNYLQKRGLSKRESEVVILVVQGLTNKQVADQLCVAEKTVKFHLTNVYKRMKISRRSQIIWTLPMARFIEQAKSTNDHIPPQPMSNPSFQRYDNAPTTGGGGGGGGVDEDSIPVGHSTVADEMDNL